jgi:hypothetical protein
MRLASVLAALTLSMALEGCVSHFAESHYLETIDPATGTVGNVFRLQVSGTTGATNVRYLSGYYDERAVDLFFNEVNANEITTNKGADQIFSLDCSGAADATACKALKEKQLAVVPYGGDASKPSAFLLILSTNADAIAGTIGSFAENQSVVQSTVALATHEAHAKASKIAAEQPITDPQRSAVFGELSAMISKVEPAAGVADADKPAFRERSYVAMLKTIAASVAPSAAPSFSTLAEARTWFAAQPRSPTP